MVDKSVALRCNGGLGVWLVTFTITASSGRIFNSNFKMHLSCEIEDSIGNFGCVSYVIMIFLKCTPAVKSGS